MCTSNNILLIVYGSNYNLFLKTSYIEILRCWTITYILSWLKVLLQMEITRCLGYFPTLLKNYSWPCLIDSNRLFYHAFFQFYGNFFISIKSSSFCHLTNILGFHKMNVYSYILIWNSFVLDIFSFVWAMCTWFITLPDKMFPYWFRYSALYGIMTVSRGGGSTWFYPPLSVLKHIHNIIMALHGIHEGIRRDRSRRPSQSVICR